MNGPGQRDKRYHGSNGSSLPAEGSFLFARMANTIDLFISSFLKRREKNEANNRFY
jgi:hypothetical protein